MAESMKDYETELEASFKKIEEGDILTGTVISVDEKEVVVDLKYYAEGIIPAEDYSREPGFSLKEQVNVGDEVSATVVSKDDGNGNILLSRTEAADVLAWDKLKELKDSKEVIDVVVKGIVNGGVIAYVEGVRGFIPASKLALNYVEDTNEYLNKPIQVQVFDIDKEKELELRRMEFFSAASHELKTPITIIKGQLQGMLCGVGRYKDRETYLAQSLEVTNSLEKMVQELLTVSRIEAPQYSCVKTHFDFTQFLRQRLAAFDDLFVQKELSVAINLLPDIYIDGDMGLLQKVVDNLLGNAATYSPPGNSVRVNLRQAEEKVYLTIENTGVHIPEDDISKLFEPFYRVEQSRNRQTGGSGLGLYIVKTIINLHNAEVSVQNTDDGVSIKVIF